MLNNNQQYFLSLDHKFRIIFIITSSLTVLSVFNRLNKLFSGHVTDQLIVRKKVSFHLRTENRDLRGNICEKAMCFFLFSWDFCTQLLIEKLHLEEVSHCKSLPWGHRAMTAASEASFEIKSARLVFSSPPKIHKTAPKFESLSSNSWVEQPTSSSSIQPTLKLLTTYNVEKGGIHERETLLHCHNYFS